MDIRAYELRLSATLIGNPDGSSACRYSLNGIEGVPEHDLAQILLAGTSRNLQVLAAMAGARSLDDLAEVLTELMGDLLADVVEGFERDIIGDLRGESE